MPKIKDSKNEYEISCSRDSKISTSRDSKISTDDGLRGHLKTSNMVATRHVPILIKPLLT